MLLAAEEEPVPVGPLYTPSQPIADVVPPAESLLIMAVSEEGYVWQWDMPLQVLRSPRPPMPHDDDQASGSDLAGVGSQAHACLAACC